MHALIIEDESLIAISIEEILGDCGFTSFDNATSCEEAIGAAHLKCPALITADVKLNPGSGIEAVNAICSGPPIPVIFITGSPSEVASLMPHHPLIAKPFNSETVMAAVKLALANIEKAPQ
ncbi:MAG: response regulator [Sphingomicrobium sp.]